MAESQVADRHSFCLVVNGSVTCQGSQTGLAQIGRVSNGVLHGSLGFRMSSQSALVLLRPSLTRRPVHLYMLVSRSAWCTTHRQEDALPHEPLPHNPPAHALAVDRSIG